MTAPTTSGETTTPGTVMKGWTPTPSGSSSPANLDKTTASATKQHNGVKWTYTNGGTTPGAAAGPQGQAAQTDNSITITGSKIKIYKAKNGQNWYQTYINKDPNAQTGKDTSTEVTVKITLVPASTQQSTGRSTK